MSEGSRPLQFKFYLGTNDRLNSNGIYNQHDGVKIVTAIVTSLEIENDF